MRYTANAYAYIYVNYEFSLSFTAFLYVARCKSSNAFNVI